MAMFKRFNVEVVGVVAGRETFRATMLFDDIETREAWIAVTIGRINDELAGYDASWSIVRRYDFPITIWSLPAMDWRAEI